MTTGEQFNGPAELKQLLLTRTNDFTRNITEKMLAYALGRGLEYYDTPVVKQITKALAREGYRSGTLVTEIVKSYPFQFRRGRIVDGKDVTGTSSLPRRERAGVKGKESPNPRQGSQSFPGLPVQGYDGTLATTAQVQRQASLTKATP
jgi:hypothetical protein